MFTDFIESWVQSRGYESIQDFLFRSPVAEPVADLVFIGVLCCFGEFLLLDPVVSIVFMGAVSYYFVLRSPDFDALLDSLMCFAQKYTAPLQRNTPSPTVQIPSGPAGVPSLPTLR